MERKRFYFAFIAILFVICFLSIGFSAFQEPMFIDETKVIVRLNDDIRVTGIQVSESTPEVISSYEDYNMHSIMTGLYLPYSDSTITYKITVTNFGNVENGIFDITGLPDNLTYELQEYTLKDKLCDSSNKCTLGSEKEFYIVIQYAQDGYDASQLNYSLNLNVDFRSYYSISYINFDNNTNYPKEVIAGDNLKVEFSYVLYDVEVYEDGVVLTNGEDYHYSDGILTIDSVNGDLLIKNVIPSLVQGYINDFREIAFSDVTYENKTEEEFNQLYGYNSGNFVYAEDGSILLNEKNTVPVFDRTLRNYSNGYSVYIVIKGDIYQRPVPTKGTNADGSLIYDEWGPATIFAMSTDDTAEKNLLTWFGFRNGYFQIYSYSYDTFSSVEYEKTDVDGYRSLKMDDKYNNQILTIQVTGVQNGLTSVYFNGELFTTFNSSIGDGRFNNATIGDLRALRGLKFTGNFYDIAIYDRVLTSEEIEQNWKYAEYTWNIK